jgi:hypothetical protein
MRNLAKRIAAPAAAAACLMLAPAAAQAQIFYSEPDFARGPIEPGDPLIGEVLPNANAAEQRAALIWNMRSGLNVGALRCQFSKYLRAVDVYNAVLAHHSTELAAAYTAIGNYFRRLHGPRQGQVLFDQWSTRTYNNFSTDNSRGFCQVAAEIGKDALSRPKGSFFALARERMRELRNSMQPYRDRIYPTVSALPPLPASLWVAAPCEGLTGQALQQCRAQLAAPVPPRR